MTFKITKEKAEELVNKFGSPLFLLDESLFIKRIKEVKDLFSKSYENFQLAYSFKTNYLKRICDLVYKYGAFAEVISGFEYDLAKLVGYSGKQIIVNGPYKPFNELVRYVKDSCIINADNKEELILINKIAKDHNKKVKIGIRVNLKIGELPWSKFGFSLENGEAHSIVKETISKLNNLELNGIHLHIGTNISNPSHYKKAVLNLLLFVRELEKQNIKISYIDFGGGFPSKDACPINMDMEEWNKNIDLQEFVKAICEPLNKYYIGKEKPLLIIEPGRLLVDESFSLISKVFSVKNIKGINSIFTDAGVNIIPSAYYRKHKIETFSIGQNKLTDIYGPLCMQVDLIESGISIPELKEGDILIIKSVGAYELSQSMQFIRERPSVVSISTNGGINLCQRKETYKDIIQRDLEVKNE